MVSESRALATRDTPPQSLQEVMSLGKIFAQSGFFANINSEAKAVVQILAGREYGFGPFSSLTGIHIIQGKPVLSAHLMATAIKRSGKYNYRVKELTDKGCTIVFTEGSEVIGESIFNEEDAKKAQLLGKPGGNWEKYPKNMYFARALSNGAKFYCPDIFEAGAYVEGEIAEAEPAAQRPRVVDIGEMRELPIAETPSNDPPGLEYFDQPTNEEPKPASSLKADFEEVDALRKEAGLNEEQLKNRIANRFGTGRTFKSLDASDRAEIKGMLRSLINELSEASAEATPSKVG